MKKCIWIKAMDDLMHQKPKVLILGDSHSVAMKLGCDALKIPNVHVWVGGLHWHEGAIQRDPVQGIRATYGRKTVTAIDDALARLEVENLLSPGVPVIGSFGYHMGQLIYPLRFLHQHAFEPATQDAPRRRGQVFSSAVAEAIVEHTRGAIHEIAFELAKNVPVTMERFIGDTSRALPNQRVFAKIIDERYRAHGIKLFDPVRLFADPDTLQLPPHLLAEDGGHGNTEFGKMSITHLLKTGLLKLD